MKLSKPAPSDKVVFVKAKSIENTYFIFRNNSEEVTITVNDNYNYRLKSSHKLYDSEMDFLREDYPHFFKKTF